VIGTPRRSSSVHHHIIFAFRIQHVRLHIDQFRIVQPTSTKLNRVQLSSTYFDLLRYPSTLFVIHPTSTPSTCEHYTSPMNVYDIFAISLNASDRLRSSSSALQSSFLCISHCFPYLRTLVPSPSTFQHCITRVSSQEQ
jgi:hypothetical protein